MRWLLMAALLAVGSAEAESLFLSKDGTSEFSIVIAEDASAPVQTAAAELQSHLQAVTGVQLPIRKEAEVAKDAPQIVVGPGPRFKQAFPDFDLSSLKHDGIAMKTAGRSIFLAGDEPRGTLYAVYTFLEDVVRCRWWSAAESFTPSRPTLEVGTLDKVYVPRLLSREAFYRGAFEGVFAARLKLNGHFAGIPAEYGGHHSILGWCHTFYQIMPPEKYFAQHPEWYSELDGKRTHERAQLCLSNEEMRAEFIKNALEWLRNRPDTNADIISVSQNDWLGQCQCERCKALEEQEGAPSGPVIHFVNAVAEAIEKEYPDVLVETLAYQYTRQAPKNVRPRNNVIVRLCTIECSYSQPLESGPQNAAFKKDIDSWSAIAPQLYIWDYVTNFKNYIMPHPNMRVLAPNIRLFVDKKAVGLFEQGDAGSTCSDFPELRAWLLAHLMWDPSLDEKALTAEFLRGYYGAAAEPLQAYIDLIHDAVERSGERLGCYMDDTSMWLSLDDLNKANALFAEGMSKVEGDAPLAARVRRARLPLDNTWLMRYHALKRLAKVREVEFSGPADPVAFAEDFIQTAKSFDVAQYREGAPFEPYEEWLRGRFTAQASPPDICKGLPESDWVDFQDAEFLLYGRGEMTELLGDVAASDGRAARMTGNHTQWAVQLPVSADVGEMGKLQCYVVARCEGDGATGGAFDIGIYDTRGKRNMTVKTFNVDEAKGYRVFDIGMHEFTPGTYVWVAPKANAGVTAVWVDRVFFVRSKN